MNDHERIVDLEIRVDQHSEMIKKSYITMGLVIRAVIFTALLASACAVYIVVRMLQ